MKKLFSIFVLTLLSFFYIPQGKGQGMAVNTTGAAADASAILDVSSASQGILVPRMTSATRTAISSPATGLLVFQTDAIPGFYYYNGTAWVGMSVPAGSAGGDLSGSYPNPAISINAAAGSNIVAAINTSSSVINASNLPVNLTSQGNVFNGNSQLVQTTAAGKLPSLDGSLLTNLPSTIPTGAAGGDLTGSYPNPTINTSPTAGTNIIGAINASPATISGPHITSGTLPVAAISTGTVTPTATTYLRGDGTWATPAGASVSGASPSGIPYTIISHIGAASVQYTNPLTISQSASLVPSVTVITPTSCTPTMTVFSFAPAAIIWKLYTVTAGTTGTWTIGSQIGSCSTAASTGSAVQCIINASSVTPNTVITLTTDVSVGTSIGYMTAFSCQ